MQRTQLSRPRLALALAAALLVSGCQNQDAGGSASASPVASPSPGYYAGQTLPAKVEQLSGTPFYSTSPDLAAKTKLEGAVFLLIAPQNPEQALLVVETGADPKEIALRASAVSAFSGTTEALEAPDLLSYVKERYQLDLKTDANGKIVVLRIAKQGSGAPAGASPTPAGARS